MFRLSYRFFATSLLLVQPLQLQIFAQNLNEQPLSNNVDYSLAPLAPLEPSQPNQPTENQDKLYNEEPLEPFTGKIVRNKVRMRLKPSLEAPILRELSRDDLLIVVGEAEEFYAVLPPKDVKAYIFRTFILDNTIEGDRVNVRLEPALEAPVIAQLNRGDQVDGVISPLNSKWLEIAPPESTRFFVCKEYVEKAGPPAMMAELERRRNEVNELLHSTYLQSQNELQKNYPEINLDKVILGYNTIIKQYSDFSDQVARAKELLSEMQDSYLQKKIAYLERKASTAEAQLASSNKQAQQYSFQPQTVQQPQPFQPQSVTPKPIQQPQPRPIEIEVEVLPEPEMVTSEQPYNFEDYDWNSLFDSNSMTGKMATWIPVEKRLYDIWASHQQNNQATPQTFYLQQLNETVVLSGIIEPYARTVNNKPGDYIIVSQASRSPIAYLYSTKVNLQDRLGHEVTVHAVKRNNNNFAFPAYFVVGIE